MVQRNRAYILDIFLINLYTLYSESSKICFLHKLIFDDSTKYFCMHTMVGIYKA
jgi:hypothetical protein